MNAQPQVKVKPKYIVYGILYLCLISVASYFTIGKAMSRSQELSNYQIDKTRRYLGEEKAKEMEQYIKGEQTSEGEQAPASTPAE